MILTCVINTYKENGNPTTEVDSMTINMKKLFVIFIGRTERNKKITFDESFDRAFRPYKIINQRSIIEEGLWNHKYGRN